MNEYSRFDFRRVMMSRLPDTSQQMLLESFTALARGAYSGVLSIPRTSWQEYHMNILANSCTFKQFIQLADFFSQSDGR